MCVGGGGRGGSWVYVESPLWPFSNVVISNQLTGKTGAREAEENHLNLRPCHGSTDSEGGQGSLPPVRVTARVNTRELVEGSDVGGGGGEG